MKHIAVIGGGASGLVAAWFSASAGNRVVLFERQKMLGRKVLASGNGRCNISNRNIDAAFYHGHNPRFVTNVFSRFGLDAAIDFFGKIGIPFVELERGRLYPASLQASAVKRMLEYELQKKGVEIFLHRKIERIIPGNKRIKLKTAGHEEMEFDSVILAAGSSAYPSLGGSASGYELVTALGHNVYQPFPAILPINIPLKPLHRLEGIKWDCGISVEESGGVIAHTEEELLFTKFGISGPAALEVSRAVNESVLAGKNPSILLDLFPGQNPEEVKDRLDALWADEEKKISFSLLGILKERMPEVVLGIAGIDAETRVKNLTAAQRDRIARTLKSVILNPGPPRSFDEAVTAAGGVDVDEVDPRTMESKIVKNLHITGELLDIDGDSGGYNLQFAWSTGALAGRAQL